MANPLEGLAGTAMKATPIGALGSLASGVLGGIGSYFSSQEQVKAGKQALNAMNTGYGQASGYQQPYYDAGQQGLGQMQNGNFGTAVPQYQQTEQQPQYNAPQFNYQASPGYNYQLQQGQKAVTNSAAARGAGMSGATMRSLAGLGTNLAAQDYGNEYNRYMQGRQQGANEYQTGLGQFNTNRNFGYGQGMDQYTMQNQQQNQRYGQAQNLANYGQTAGTNMGNLATGLAGQQANIYGQMGNAKAAGLMGLTNALGSTGNTLGQMGQLAMSGNYMNNLVNTGGK